MRHRFWGGKRERKMAWYFDVVVAAALRGHNEQFFFEKSCFFVDFISFYY